MQEPKRYIYRCTLTPEVKIQEEPWSLGPLELNCLGLVAEIDPYQMRHTLLTPRSSYIITSPVGFHISYSGCF